MRRPHRDRGLGAPYGPAVSTTAELVPLFELQGCPKLTGQVKVQIRTSRLEESGWSPNGREIAFYILTMAR